MVQTVEPAKQQDHSVIRQLLSTAVRVPHVAVLTLHSKNSCSSNNNGNNKSKNICNNNEEKFSVKNSSISVELIQPEEKNISDLSDIELSAGSELFPEIGLSLPDLQDIDDMVTTETCPSPPDYSSAVLNSSEAESVMYSFPASEVVVSSSPDGREDNSVSLSMTSPGTREAASPMQICSSDSEAASSPPPVQHAFPSPQQSLPTKTSTTIRTLLNQPPLNQVRSGYPAALSQSSVDQPGPSSEMMIPATLDPGPAIPLSVLALGDHESAPMAQMILKQMDEQNPPQSSSAPSSDEEDYAEPEPARPARRRWVKAAPDAAVPPSRKKERKLSSVSSEQDLDPDYDDLDSEVNFKHFQFLVFQAGGSIFEARVSQQRDAFPHEGNRGTTSALFE